MYVQDISADDITNFFLNDPNVCYLGLDDNDLTTLYTEKVYNKHSNSNYYGVYNDLHVLMAIYKYEWFTTTTINAHLYLGTKYQKKRMPQKILEFLIKMSAEQLPAKKVIILTPQACIHVIHSVEKCGFKLEGVLTDAIVWRKELVNLLIYGMKLEPLC